MSAKDILVVDDEPINYKLLNAILSRNGYSVQYAENGYKAIDMCHDNDYSLLIMDIKMPGINGIEATKQIIKDKPGTIVVASSAKKEMEDSEYSLFVDFLSKPINRERLLSLVEKYAK